MPSVLLYARRLTRGVAFSIADNVNLKYPSEVVNQKCPQRVS